MTLVPPRAEKRPHPSVRHGHERIDDYAWLKDPNWQAAMRDPAVLQADIRDYLEAENAYTEAVLAPLAELRERLFAELKGRIKEDDSSVPTPDGPVAYYTRFVPGAQHPLFCRRPREGGAEEVLLDASRAAEGHPFFRVGYARHSPDHRLHAYSVDLNGSEYHRIRLADPLRQEILEEGPANTQGEIVWAPDGGSLLYVVLDDHHRPSKVFRHRLGTDWAEDELVLAEPDPSFYLNLHLCESRRFAVITGHDHATSEVHVLDLEAGGPLRLIAPRRAEVEYDVTHHGERFLITTNADGAEDFKVVEAPLDAPGPENWRDLVPHEPGRLIRGIQVFADHLVVLERARGLPRLTVTRFSDGASHRVDFEEEAYDLGVAPGYEYATTNLRFAYGSPATPGRVYDYDMDTRQRVLRKEQEIPSGHDPAAYTVRRLFVAAVDGAQVPVTVLHRRQTPIDGSAPLFLYGYGSYGISMPARFDADVFSLVDRGFVYAVAHVRGGSDMGRAWYRNGKLEAKANTFGDFVAAAEHLVAEGYGSAGRIAANGRSAGGMLMGAIANMRPELFRAIVAEVPFLDVLNTMLDDTLPLTPPEWTEWGNPIADEAAYRRILSYSPYDNVARQAYPWILATAGITDPRVTYWEPAKWVARLREAQTGESPILLHTNMDAGHGGASGRFERLKESALVYAFVLMAFGMAGKA